VGNLDLTQNGGAMLTGPAAVRGMLPGHRFAPARRKFKSMTSRESLRRLCGERYGDLIFAGR
jgi:hypothetical protein